MGAGITLATECISLNRARTFLCGYGAQMVLN